MTSKEESLVVLKPGDRAPLFTAQIYPAGKFELSTICSKTNLILAFYPKDDTPGCTLEICAFTNDLALFESSGTAVFGISCDSLESHQQFAAKHNLKVPLISDPDGAVSRLYGTIREGRQSANRKLFVIDKKGIIRHTHDGMPDNKSLLELIGGL